MSQMSSTCDGCRCRVAHWRAAAPAADQEKLFWIVARHEIDYKQAAYAAMQIVARTWVAAATRIRFERHTEVLRARDAMVLAVARTSGSRSMCRRAGPRA